MRFRERCFNVLPAFGLVAAMAVYSAQTAATDSTALETKPPAATPVSINGQLKVCGNSLCNKYGKAIQLRGMSTHGIQWYGWGKCITEGSLDALAQDWGADVVRVSLYVQEGGYETNPQAFTAQAELIVDELIERGLYVLIDWHMLTPGDPMANLARATDYFTYMSKKYASTPNVLYEIANEPNGVYKEGRTTRRVDWQRIKSYAEKLIPVIRAHASEGIIIVGTPDWSSFGVSGGSNPSEVYKSPLSVGNVMYSFHFYAGEHTDKYRRALDDASDKLPVFVTEWGSQLSSGDGPNDFPSAQAYLDLMARKKISWANWNYSDDRRSGAAFKPGTCRQGGPWTDDTLKEAGKWVRERIRTPPDDFPVK